MFAWTLVHAGAVNIVFGHVETEDLDSVWVALGYALLLITFSVYTAIVLPVAFLLCDKKLRWALGGFIRDLKNRNGVYSIN